MAANYSQSEQCRMTQREREEKLLFFLLGATLHSMQDLSFSPGTELVQPQWKHTAFWAAREVFHNVFYNPSLEMIHPFYHILLARTDRGLTQGWQRSLGAILEAGYPEDKSCYASMAESQNPS